MGIKASLTHNTHTHTQTLYRERGRKRGREGPDIESCLWKLRKAIGAEIGFTRIKWVEWWRMNWWIITLISGCDNKVHKFLPGISTHTHIWFSITTFTTRLENIFNYLGLPNIKCRLKFFWNMLFYKKKHNFISLKHQDVFQK